jgi:hypothetical protein
VLRSAPMGHPPASGQPFEREALGAEGVFGLVGLASLPAATAQAIGHLDLVCHGQIVHRVAAILHELDGNQVGERALGLLEHLQSLAKALPPEAPGVLDQVDGAADGRACHGASAFGSPRSDSGSAFQRPIGPREHHTPPSVNAARCRAKKQPAGAMDGPAGVKKWRGQEAKCPCFARENPGVASACDAECDAFSPMARITTHEPRDPFVVPLHEWAAIGLPEPSTIRLVKLELTDLSITRAASFRRRIARRLRNPLNASATLPGVFGDSREISSLSRLAKLQRCQSSTLRTNESRAREAGLGGEGVAAGAGSEGVRA